MDKPQWRVRSSSYVVDSPYMRLRADELELPDGTIVSNYYVRESFGFVTILALTTDRQVILVRQYRYGADSIHLELPAGMLIEGEAPQECALRELAEETGYEVARCEPAASTCPNRYARRRALTFTSASTRAGPASRSSTSPSTFKSSLPRCPLSRDARRRNDRRGRLDRRRLPGTRLSQAAIKSETCARAGQ